MSALGQKRTFCDVETMPALPPKADISQRAQNFRFTREWTLVSALTSSGMGPRAISCAFVCLRTSTLALPKNGKPKAIADLFG